jgi:hypothetical protein
MSAAFSDSLSSIRNGGEGRGATVFNFGGQSLDF